MQQQRKSPGWMLEAAVVLYYVLPMAVFVLLAFLASGWLKNALLISAVAWPMGNIIVGVVKGCD